MQIVTCPEQHNVKHVLKSHAQATPIQFGQATLHVTQAKVQADGYLPEQHHTMVTVNVILVHVVPHQLVNGIVQTKAPEQLADYVVTANTIHVHQAVKR